MPTPPSGEQVEISHGPYAATTVELGGALRTLTHDGEPLLDGYAAEEMCEGARGQTLVPWPNRVQDGRWSWQGEDLQLALTEPDQHNAIHGLVRWSPATLVDRSESEATWEVRTFPQPGWPWPISTRIRYRLDDAGLSVTTTITNHGDSPAPVASGAHPYVTVGTPTIDTAELHVDADTWLPTGPQQIPTGREPVAGSPYDFRSARPIGDIEIDYTFTDLHRDDDGLFRVRLLGPQRGVSFWLDAAYPYLEVFTGDALPTASRRRQGLGLEPMTAPPNALATGEDLVVIAPGESWTGVWGITAVGG